MKQLALYGKGICYKIPNSLADRKYHGCGNGIIVVDDKTGEVVDMNYLDANDHVINRQNYNMIENAGDLFESRAEQTVFRANFSCGQACLF